MKKVLKFLKKNIFLTILSLFVLIGVIIILVVMFKFFISGNDKYGNRLDGINKVEITSKTLSKIDKKIEDEEEVDSASIRIQGKIIYITIKYKEGTSKDRAKEIANSTLEHFDEEELNFYDVGYFLTSKGETEFNITGNKKAKRDNISYIKS